MPFVEYQTRSIHYRETGTGIPVIAIHGSASSGAQWESMTDCLAAKYRVIRPGLPGYGKSAPLCGGAATNASFAEIVDSGHMAPMTDPHLIDPMIAVHIQSIDDQSISGDANYAIAA